MLPSALLASLLSGDSVHYGIRLFGLIEGAAFFGAVSTPHRGWTKFAFSQSPGARDPKRSDERSRTRLALGPLRRDHHLLPFLFGYAASFKLPVLRSGGCFAAARRVLRSPTNCVVAPPVSSPRPPQHVSLSSWLPGRLSPLRDVSSPSPVRRDLGCSGRCLPEAFSASHLPLRRCVSGGPYPPTERWRAPAPDMPPPSDSSRSGGDPLG